MNVWIVILAIGLLHIGLHGVVSDNVCTEVPVPSTKMVDAQSMETEFVVDIEVVKKEISIVQNMRMYYSQAKKMIRLDILDDQVKTMLYFFYDNNEILSFNQSPSNGRGKCSVFQDLGKAMDDFWFGSTNANTGNSPVIPAPMAALHFQGLSGFSTKQIKQLFIGHKNIRGKNANIYTSCQKWTSSQSNIVVNVTHSFAYEIYHFPFTNRKNSTLLSMEVTGTGIVNNQDNTPIDHIYNYFNFRGFENDYTYFETPDGIVCPGRKKDSSKTFPSLSNYIKFTGEVIDSTRKRFNAKEEVYDFNNKFAIVKSINNLDSKDDLNRKTMVFNFIDNILMTVDEVDRTCQTHNISSFKPILDLYTIQRGRAVMQDAKSYFMADPKDFTYLGQKEVRGMMTDVWVASSSIMKGAVIQFHFSPKVTSWNDGVKGYQTSNWAEPIKVKMWENEFDTAHITENIFHVDYAPLTADYIDLSSCFDYSYRMQIALGGSKADVIKSYQELFYAKAKIELAAIGGISYHQINQLKAYYQDSKIILDFLVWDRDELSAKRAVQKIKTALTSGQISLDLQDPKTNKWNLKTTFISAKSTKVSLDKGEKKSTSDDSGFSQGSLAGLGVAMALVGLLGGAGAGFAHGKYFG